MILTGLPFYELRMVEEGVRVIFAGSTFVVPTFGIPVDPWATLVMLGVLLGMEVARARGLKMGFEPRDVVDGIIFTVLAGFFMAHVITVVAYFPERLSEEGIWAILKVWEGFSSTGGFLGSLLAIWLFYGYIRPLPILRMADLIAYGFPLGWFFGRLGCAVVHDHIGVPTEGFPLAVNFPAGHYAAGLRHELGLYEALLMVPVMAAFWWLGREDRPPGTFMGLFFVVYAPIRFGLDQLRAVDLASADARYFGLTPAQYGMVALFLFGAGLLAHAWRHRDDPKWSLDHPDAPGPVEAPA